MNEKELEMKVMRKRNLIKNILIIFLIILLLLTFFSNTIMNRSLPEVSTIYLYSGEIKTQIRGTGLVSVAGSFNQQAEETRMVQSVEAVVGDQVEKGQLLYKLTDVTYSGIEEYKNAYESAKDAYEKSCILNGLTESQVIKLAETTSDKALKTIIALDAKLDAAEAKKAEHEAVITENESILVGLGGAGAVNSSEMTNYNSAEYNKTVVSLQYSNLLEMKTAATTKSAYYNEKNQGLGENSAYSSADCQNIISTNNAAIEACKAEYEALVAAGDSEGANLKAQEIKTYENNVAYFTAAFDIKKNLEEANAKLAELEGQIVNAEINLNDAEVYLNNAKIALESKKNTCSVYEGIIASENASIALIDKEISDIQSEKADYISDSTDASETVLLYKSYLNAKDKYDKAVLAGKGDEIYAKVSGTLTSLPIASGVKFNAGDVIATIDQGTDVKTMTMTVSVEEAARLKVGDPATVVNSWRYENASITLRSITQDRTNPKNKVLTFDVVADVNDGQSLSVNVGNRNTVYDRVIPNSAIREDSDGKYILVLKARSTPLGNRYYAEKVEVKVVASDDSNSAVTGTFENWEYVIKTSSAPIKAGSQVKLAEGIYY